MCTLTSSGPVAQEKYPLHKDILANLRSGLTVGLVNLPLSVSLAIAAGATPEPPTGMEGKMKSTWDDHEELRLVKMVLRKKAPPSPPVKASKKKKGKRKAKDEM